MYNFIIHKFYDYESLWKKTFFRISLFYKLRNCICHSLAVLWKVGFNLCKLYRRFQCLASHLFSLNFAVLFNLFGMQKFFWRIRDNFAIVLLFKSKYLFSKLQALNGHKITNIIIDYLNQSLFWRFGWGWS